MTLPNVFREFQEASWTPTAGYTAPSPSPPDGLVTRYSSSLIPEFCDQFCVQGSEVAHPGVAPEDPEDRAEHVYHKYYQVCVTQMCL